VLTAKQQGREGSSSDAPRHNTDQESAGGRERTSRLLRQERERRQLSLEDVAQRTHIPLAYLQLLEGSGNAWAVPDPLYLIAPLQTYAAFLQLELGAALTDFMTEVEQLPMVQKKVGRGLRLLHSLSAFPQRPTAFVPGTLLLLLTLGSLAVVGHYSGQPGTVRPTAPQEAPPFLPLGPAPAPDAGTPQAAVPLGPLSTAPDVEPPVSSAVAPAGSAPVPAARQSKLSVAAVPRDEAPVPQAALPSPQSPSSALHRLRVRAQAQTWLELTVDGHPLKRMLLAPGHSQEWVAKQGFTLSVGNAGAVKLSLDGQALPPVGRTGQRALNVRLPTPSKSPEPEGRTAARPRGTKPR
jgi:cytoskeleton protein RodZ